MRPDRSSDRPVLRRRSGFTLIELLVVIGIIVILIAILLPVVASVRKSANVAATKSQMSAIASACQAYYGDYHAYPGPFSENQIDANGPWSVGAITGSGPLNITSTENLLLGLSGGVGLTFPPGGGPPTAFNYSPALIGSGPQVLNTLISAQKQTTAYYTPTPAELAPSDGAGGYLAYGSADSVIPEYYDHIPGSIVGVAGINSSMQFGPILYMRARVAAPGLVNEPGLAGNYFAPGTAAIGYQYNFNQLIPYGFTQVPNPTAPANPGDATDFAPPDGSANNPNPPAGSSITYDSVTVYFANPSLGGQPKSKDGFILISAGPDRQFGTKDDIISGN
jgi:prepilin-type N-terminal cleavage/methylation domain-containing protein